MILTGHKDFINAACWSPDGQKIVSGGWDRVIKIWDIKTKKEIFEIPVETNLVWNLCWCPGEKIIAACDSSNASILIWDINSKQLLNNVNLGINLDFCMTFSPDGQKIAIATRTPNQGNITIIDIETAKIISTIYAHNQNVRDLKWSPDGKKIASCGVDKTIKIRNAISGKCMLEIKEHKDTVRSIDWSPDSKNIVSGSDDKTVRIWNAYSGKLIRTINNYDHVTSVTWNQKKNIIASMLFTYLINIYNPKKRKLIRSIKIPFQNRSGNEISWSPCGHRLMLIGDNKNIIIKTILATENCAIELIQGEDGFFGLGNKEKINDSQFQALAHHAEEENEFYAITDWCIENRFMT